MATCATPTCSEQHGLVDHLCGDCRRWTERFTPEELEAITIALATRVGMYAVDGDAWQPTADLFAQVTAALVRQG